MVGRVSQRLASSVEGLGKNSILFESRKIWKGNNFFDVPESIVKNDIREAFNV